MGSSKDRYDDQGREKAQCKICTGFYHRVDIHLGKKHAGTSLEDYKARYPSAELESEAAKESAKRKDQAERAPTEVAGVDEGTGEDFTVMQFGCATITIRTDLTKDEQQFVPNHDENWKVGKEETNALEALALAIESNQNVLIVGPAGLGKSTLARELAAIVNQPLRYLPINGEMRTDDLMGGDQLLVDPATGQSVTKYQDGPLVAAAQAGHWVLLDEFDSIPSHVGFILHGAFEAERKLTRSNGVPVKFHESFRVIATANTLGLGDESGMYAGTAPMNRALLDRFGIIIQMNYPSAADETERVVAQSGLDRDKVKQMVAVAGKVREAQSQESTNADMSSRRLIMWAKAAKKMDSVHKAALYTVLNRLSSEDSQFVGGIIQRYFGKNA